MDILRVFNNNVVLVRDGNEEVIITGRGIGFQAKPGQHVDESRVGRKFILVADALVECGIAKGNGNSGKGSALNPILTVALADHVVGALNRLKSGTPVEYPLIAEVKTLYPDEYSQATALLSYLNAHLDNALPGTEAVAFALHLVNAGFSTGDLSYTYQMTGVIQQIVKIIEHEFAISVDQSTVSIGRFITHLRYLFVRSYQNKQLTNEPLAISKAIQDSYPDEYKCARTIASITDDEVAYLTLHIARVRKQAAQEAERDGSAEKPAGP